jgi:hypothetical protein
MLIFHTGQSAVKYPHKHDPNEKVYYSFGWGVQPWLAGLECLVDDVRRPSIPNGFYYVCEDPGVSGNTEPDWDNTAGSLTVDNTVGWRAIPYDVMLRHGDTFTSTWSVNHQDIILDETGSDNGITWVRVSNVPDDLLSFTLSNRIVVSQADGKSPQYERSMVIKVKEL